MQVNFRGSTGYGKDFVNAGDKRVGRQDARRPARRRRARRRQGLGRPPTGWRSSAAPTAATPPWSAPPSRPTCFACAVDIVGPSNLKTLIESIPPYWAPIVAQFHDRVGNPETEEEFLWERSPLSRVDDIKIPLLIAQGANDPRVKQAESEQIVAAMNEKGIDHEYLLFPDEGHGFAKPENRMKFFAAAERFLAKHLGGRFEDP